MRVMTWREAIQQFLPPLCRRCIPSDSAWFILPATSSTRILNPRLLRERERNAFACIERHQAFALAPRLLS